ncbi:MAG: alpha-L-fucosidase [Clostridiales bacterium]|nr:alpha-L-fucosidase [Clostridiales bacterium]
MAKNPDIKKWRSYKFGMFLHYGLYSVIGEGEWVMFQKPIDKDEYALTMKDFTAENFDAAGLASLARGAGMKYMVLTARHHDGFCLFDSKHSIGDYTVMNTPAQRDLIKEYTDACRAAGLGVGIYYSPMDWRCEGFFLPGMYRKSAMAMREQCHRQVRELVTGYGTLDVLWYDGGEDYWLAHGVDLRKGCRPEDFRENPPIEEFWGELELDEMVREAQPGIVVGNRLGMRRTGDYLTPERVVGGFNPYEPWETCDTLSETWGWTPGGRLRPAKDVIRLLINVITGGGNLLLNLSPRGDGSPDPTHAKRLREVGSWLAPYADAVYPTDGGPLRNSKDRGGFTSDGCSLFCWLMDAESARIPLISPAGREAGKTPARICDVISRSRDTEYTIDGDILTVTRTDGGDGIASLTEIVFDSEVSRVYDDINWCSDYDAFGQ